MENTLRKNFFLNMLKTILSIAFPFITYPYAARTLLPEGIGRVDFVISIVSYFQLIASLGINTYAITEGAKIRDNLVSFQKFASEIFSINVISTLFAYVLLLSVLTITSLESYQILLLIISSGIFFNLIGVNWIFYIFEDFKYITLRTIGFQFIALFMMLIFVKGPHDVNVYAFLTVFSSVGSNVMNFYYSQKKYIKLKFIFPQKCILKKHIKPILIMFFASATSSIYLNFDKTILGMEYGDLYVGLYSLSAKIISVVLVLIVALRDVFMPRIAYCIANEGTESVDNLIENALSLIYLIIIPSAVGIFTMSRNLILLIASNAFVMANISLKILAVKLLFAPVNGFLAYQILIPLRRENLVGFITACGAIVNIALNIILVRYFTINGVAVASVLSEFIIFCLLLKHIKIYVKWLVLFQQIIQFFIGSLPIVILYVFLDNRLSANSFLLTSIISSIVAYFFILYTLRNKTLIKIIK